MSREQIGIVARVVLGLTFIAFGVTMMLPLAIPPWAIGAGFAAGGVLLLVGR